MKIVIGYDASSCADAALEDLRRAGLPDDVDALVLSVADLWLLPQEEVETTGPLGPSAAIREARATAAEMLQKADVYAKSAASRLRQLFPTWQVHAENAADSPAWAIILKAEEWGADLIVVGSHGYSALGRWVLGSVSQTVLTHARCSVRVARSRPTEPNRPLRILIGVDGSKEADLAVRTVASRQWPDGTDIRLVMVVNPSIISSIEQAAAIAGAAPALEQARQEEVQANGTASSEAKEMDSTISRLLENYRVLISQSQPKATVSTKLLSGDPKRLMVEEAESWGADSIFIGSRGLSRWERLLLGSVSSAVAMRAHCPVEVVREPFSQA
jgi:nucleotide-binding universal stress UspA family protein